MGPTLREGGGKVEGQGGEGKRKGRGGPVPVRKFLDSPLCVVGSSLYKWTMISVSLVGVVLSTRK